MLPNRMHAGMVTILDLRDNNLTGTLARQDNSTAVLTSIIGELRSLVEADVLSLLACNLHRLLLQKNRISGTIPESISQVTSLRALGLGENRLSGTIPLGIGELPYLQEIDLTRNRLTGVWRVDVKGWWVYAGEYVCMRECVGGCAHVGCIHWPLLRTHCSG